MNRQNVSGTGSRSRTSDIYDRIRHDIIRGGHPPGAKLKVEALREQYASGATPIREALSLLTADGLVAREHQRGFRVADISTAEFEELLAIRCFIEGRALRLAMERGGGQWEEDVVLARHRLLGRASWQANGNETEWEDHHRNFHMALISACGSRILLRLSGQLYDENSRYRHIARLKGGGRPTVYQEHDQIAEAVLARDADLAVQLLETHYRTTGKLLREALENMALSGAGTDTEIPSPALRDAASSDATS